MKKIKLYRPQYTTYHNISFIKLKSNIHIPLIEPFNTYTL